MIFSAPKPNYFCISIQRTGTTSVGRFFKDHGLKVANYYRSRNNEWSQLWLKGNYDAIFSSKDFKKHQVFEDDPWWLPDFYKVLYHRFPSSKFILFVRDEKDWWQSMLNHSEGKSLGNTYLHSKIYRRENDFYSLFLDQKVPQDYDINTVDNLLELEGYKEHYISLYRLHQKEVIDFFAVNAPESLFVTDLNDPDKWMELGDFAGIEVLPTYHIHANPSKK